MTDDEQFDYFWDLYAFKVGSKPAAKRAFLRLSKQHRRDACAGLKDRIANDRKWLGGIRMHPSTYLNGHRWEDHWERHVPRSQRPDNVRDTTNEKVDLTQEQRGLAKLREMCGPDNDPAPLNLGKSSDEIRKEAMGKMVRKLATKLDYKPQDESTEQARKQELERQANSLLGDEHANT